MDNELNLQTGSTENTQPGAEQNTQTEGKTFTQDEVNKIINERLNKERIKHTKDIETKILEATKVAQMTAEERFQHDLKQREAAIREKELEFQARELRIKAIDKLAEAGLSSSLLNVIDYSNAEALEKNIEVLKNVILESVNAGIDNRLRGNKPPKTGKDISLGNDDAFLQGLKKS